MEIILHQAALPSVPRSINDPITSNEVNVVGRLNILKAAKGQGVRRVVYASSFPVYGDDSVLPKVETMTHAYVSLCGFEACRRAILSGVLRIVRR